jgi:hypothetical protein
MKKGAYMRLLWIYTSTLLFPGRDEAPSQLGRGPVRLPFDVLHLVFEAQLQFLQPHFF